jgi:hypothetical protein
MRIGCVITLPCRSMASAILLLLASILLSGCDSKFAVVRKLKDSDPATRKQALNEILKNSLEGDRMSGWQMLQTKGCIDPDPTVRKCAVEALSKLIKSKPGWIVTDGVLKAEYLDNRVFSRLGAADPSPDVRASVAALWENADVWPDLAIQELEKMASADPDKHVKEVAATALRRRLELNFKSGRTTEQDANRIAQKNGLGPLDLKKPPPAPLTPLDIPKPKELVVPFFSMGLVGYAIAAIGLLSTRINHWLLKSVGYIGALYLLLFSIFPFIDLRMWARAPGVCGLWLTCLVVGAALASETLLATPVTDTKRRPTGTATAIVAALSLCLCILTYDFRETSFLLRFNHKAYGIVASYSIALGVLCLLISLIRRAKWLLLVLGSLPILFYYNAWVAVPLVASYVLGCSLGFGRPVPRWKLSGSIVAMFVVCTVLYSHLSIYIFGGYGVFFNTQFAPALISGALFPFVFATGATLHDVGGRTTGSRVTPDYNESGGLE